jgi:protoporphyrinogen oxidase
MRVAVIGAGPAGMTAAYELAKSPGVDVTLFEASPQVGGLAKTIELWGQRVDLGPHRFFSQDTRVNKLWLEVVGRDYSMVRRLTRIFYKNRFFYYPLRPGNALRNLGPVEAAACLLSYGRERVRPTPLDGTFEHWVVNRFGRRLFEIFFKTYSEKLWGISCTELDADFAAQRIKKLSLLEAVKNAFLGGRGNTHKSLVDEFAYPHGGTGTVYERMAAAVSRRGGRVRLSTPIRAVATRGGRVVGVDLEDGTFEAYDHVVSSMPLTLLVARLAYVPEAVRRSAETLRFRNTILVYLHVRQTGLFPDNWLYVHSPELRTGRVTNFRNWVPQLYGKEEASILALEYWCNDDEPLWSEDDARLIARATAEIARTGLCPGHAIDAGHVHRIKRCYPIYERGYRARLEPVERHLSSIDGLSVVGRYGAFKYNNQDHSMLMGLLAARSIAAGAGRASDLWSVNTDYDAYQEAARASAITAGGLVEA